MFSFENSIITLKRSLLYYIMGLNDFTELLYNIFSINTDFHSSNRLENDISLLRQEDRNRNF
jgi:hypothetical protein